jgi:hypothetical protein
MSSDVQFPIYQAPPWSAKSLLSIGLGAVILFMVSVQLIAGSTPLWVPFAIPLLVVALSFALASVLRQRSTDTDREHLTIRGMTSTRRTAWNNIQAIAIERNWAGVDYADVYDRDGHKLTLPWVNSGTLPDLETEVSQLRELWTMLRGESWGENLKLHAG